ncbi:unnamed protein product, partial [Closterium sp. NIES-53]
THGTDKGASSPVARFSNNRGWEPRNNQRTGLHKAAQQFRMARSSDVDIRESGMQGAKRGVNYGSGLDKAPEFHMATARDLAIHRSGGVTRGNGLDKAPQFRMATSSDVAIRESGMQGASRSVNYGSGLDKAQAFHMVTARDVAIHRSGGVTCGNGLDKAPLFRMATSSDVAIRESGTQGESRGVNHQGAGFHKAQQFRMATSSDVAIHRSGMQGKSRGMSYGSEIDKAPEFHMATARDVAIHRSGTQGAGRNRGVNHGSGLDKAQQFPMATSSDVAIHRSGTQGVSRGVNHGSGLDRAPEFHMATARDVAIHRSGGVNRGNGLDKAPQFRMATSSDVAITHTSGTQGKSRGVNYGGERLGSLAFAQAEGGDCDGDNNGNNGGDNGTGGDNGVDNGSGSGNSGGGPIDIGAILEVHNAARREVGVADLAWDDGVAAAAQEWASQLAAAGCPLQHGGADGLGQNLYWRAPTGLTPEEDRMAVQAWVDEKADWTPSPVPEGCVEGRMCGHYTQVVWAGTTHVGCASAQCPDGGGMWDDASGEKRDTAALATAVAAAPVVGPPADAETAAAAQPCATGLELKDLPYRATIHVASTSLTLVVPAQALVLIMKTQHYYY